MFSIFKKPNGPSSRQGHAGHGGGCGGGHGHHDTGGDEEHGREPDVPSAADPESSASGSAPVAADEHHTHA